MALLVKNPPADAGDTESQVQSLGQEDPLEEDMATHSSNLAGRILWKEETGGLQSLGPVSLHSNQHLVLLKQFFIFSAFLISV